VVLLATIALACVHAQVRVADGSLTLSLGWRRAPAVVEDGMRGAALAHDPLVYAALDDLGDRLATFERRHDRELDALARAVDQDCARRDAGWNERLVRLVRSTPDQIQVTPDPPRPGPAGPPARATPPAAQA